VEHWIPWGEGEVFFEAPEELSVTILDPRPLSEAEVRAKASTLPDHRVVVIDYTPPPTPYKMLLERLALAGARVFLSAWRLGPRAEGGALRELAPALEGVDVGPIEEMPGVEITSGRVLLLYHQASRVLLGSGARDAKSHLSLILRLHGLGDLPLDGAEVVGVELSYGAGGAVNGLWIEGEQPEAEPVRADSLVVSPGGAPLDSTLYLAAQSVILSAAGLEGGSSILLAAECREGVGPPGFAKSLYHATRQAGPGYEDGPALIVAERLAETTRRHRLYIATSLPRSIVDELLGVKTFETVQEGVTQLIKLHGRGHRMMIVREGFHTVITGHAARPSWVKDSEDA